MAINNYKKQKNRTIVDKILWYCVKFIQEKIWLMKKKRILGLQFFKGKYIKKQKTIIKVKNIKKYTFSNYQIKLPRSIKIISI